MTWAIHRPLLPLTWTELVRHYLEGNQASPPFVEARAALDALKQGDYCRLSGAHRLKLLEALIHAVADTEIVRKCVTIVLVCHDLRGACLAFHLTNISGPRIAKVPQVQIRQAYFGWSQLSGCQ